jgi:putative transposase
VPDAVHLLCDINPKRGVFTIVNMIKGYIFLVLEEAFLILKSHIPTLWTQSEFISYVGGVTIEDVKKYVEEKKHA